VAEEVKQLQLVWERQKKAELAQKNAELATAVAAHRHQLDLLIEKERNLITRAERAEAEVARVIAQEEVSVRNRQVVAELAERALEETAAERIKTLEDLHLAKVTERSLNANCTLPECALNVP
jgi:hypothetical protein